MRSVTFLPEEFPGSNEGSWVLEFPSHDVGPLIQLQGQVTVASDPLLEGWVHDRLTGWTNSDWFSKVTTSALSDPSNLGGETLDVILLQLQCTLSDEEWEVGILHTELLDLTVEPVLDLLPDLVRMGASSIFIEGGGERRLV